MQHAANTNSSDKNQKAGRRKKFKGNQSDKTSNSDKYKIDFSHLTEDEIEEERKRISTAHRKGRKKRIILYLIVIASITIGGIFYSNYSKQKKIEYEYLKITGLSMPSKAKVIDFKSKISSKDTRAYIILVELKREDFGQLKDSISQHHFSIHPNYKTSLELDSYIKSYSDSFNEQYILYTGNQFRFVRFYADKTVLLISNAKFLSFEPPKKIIKKTQD